MVNCMQIRPQKAREQEIIVPWGTGRPKKKSFGILNSAINKTVINKPRQVLFNESDKLIPNL